MKALETQIGGNHCNLNRYNYFSVHSVKALEKRAFSIVHGNIENTKQKWELAREIYPIEDYHFEFHNDKIDLSPVIFKR